MSLPPASPHSPTSLRLLLLGWAVLITVPMTMLVARHSLALPTAIPEASPLPATGQWQAVHLLAAECGCSALVADYLKNRRPEPGLKETVYLLGEEQKWENDLHTAGFRVSQVDPDEVARETGIQGAPWLLLIRPDGSVAYSGGYAPQRPQGADDLRDLTLWRAAAAGAIQPSFPSFGCATSAQLRRAFHPGEAVRRRVATTQVIP